MRLCLRFNNNNAICKAPQNDQKSVTLGMISFQFQNVVEF